MVPARETMEGLEGKGGGDHVTGDRVALELTDWCSCVPGRSEPRRSSARHGSLSSQS